MKYYLITFLLFSIFISNVYGQINEEKSIEFYLTADSLVDLENYERAIEMLDSSIYYNSENFDSYSLKGFCYLKKEEYSIALENFDLALILEPNYAEVYYLRGITKLELKENKSACNDFIEAYALGMKDAIRFIEEYCELNEEK